MKKDLWRCTWCGGGAEDELALLDHQEWCLGDALANTRMLSEVAEKSDGELTQEALVEAARKRRPAGGSGDRSPKGR
ncbi:MAG TPA: hypothetical protein VKA75_07200 [Reyranella sp.]|nr:hypothetical protein [Reyranella sp.]